MSWLWIIGAIIIIYVVYLYYRYTTKEGFVTIPNVQYPFKEVFLMAPTEDSEQGNKMMPFVVPTSGTYNNRGYTWENAQKVCQAIPGGDLATVAQIQKAYDNSGNWCIAGWSKDNQTTAYYLPSKINMCGLTRAEITATVNSKTLPSTDPTPQTRAFPICYAVKPPEPTVSVVPFNSTRYSMIPIDFLNSVTTGITNGVPGDIFPITFTPSQAYYAIDKHGTKPNNHYDFKLAREWLITNYESVNTSILTELGITDDSAQWSNLETVRGSGTQQSKSCNDLKIQDDDISRKILQIQTAFRDVSGYVMAAVQSKTENARIQAMLYNICKGTRPTQSPACSKLATIDFDLFYNTDQNTIFDLEKLNLEIYRRKDEICQLLRNVRIIKGALSCTYDNLIPECAQGCNIVAATASTDGIFDCSNSPIFDINNVGYLKYSLEQLSPLFQVNDYKTLLTEALGQLSYMIETPIATNFVTTESNMRLINAAIRDVTDLIEETASA